MPEPLNTDRPFTRADAVAAGVDPRTIRGSRFRGSFRGVYVRSRVEDSVEIRAGAAVRVQAGPAVVSHSTAAQLWKVPVPTTSTTHVTVATKEAARPRPGLVAHVATRPPEVHALDGVPVTGPIDTFVALARTLDLVDLVIAGDAMVRLGLVTVEHLVHALDHRHDAGSVRAREAARFVRARADSPMESRLRMLLVLAGLPEPEVNAEIRHHDGEPRFRFDLAYRWMKVAVEYDGRQHADDARTHRRDLRRREDLDRLGWLLVVVTAHDLFKDPQGVIARVVDAMARRGQAPHTIRFSRAWERHFAA